MFVARLMFLRIASVVSCLILAACGSGGGGGDGAEDSSTAPYILAAVLSFPETNVPAGFVPDGYNSEVSVTVLDSTTDEPITNASVSVNGIPLAYVPASQEYEGGISVSPGSSITLNVTVGSTTYTSTATQFSSYPAITSPLTDATWVSTESNLAAWSGVAPTANSLYALGVFDTNGELIWPYGGSIQFLSTTTTSYTISPWSLTAGERLLIVGLMDLVDIPNAHPDSGFIIGGFNYVPITVVNARPATLQSIAVTPNNPTVTVGKTKQLTATGSYSDGSTQDLTAQAAWQSSDPAKATVSSTGLVAGQNYGSTTVTATLGSISGSTLVNVFQPTPSPAPPLSQAVTYQIDYAHSGNAVFPYSITFPSSPAWSITLNGDVSYPLIANGKVYVTTSSPGAGGGFNGTSLYALDGQTGAILWEGPVAISGNFHWSAIAYDHGKIFVINYEGLLRSFDAATGTPGWSKQLPGQSSFTSPPTAVNGIVYVGGAGSGGTLYAVDESNGNVLWTAGVANGMISSPALSSDGVFVSYPCQDYKFDPITGASLWHYSGPCQGGGGTTPVFANGLLYVRDPILSGINNPSNPEPPGYIFDATSGTQVGTFNAGPIPAIGTSTGFFLNGGVLQAVDLTTHNLLWSFAGDEQLVSAPIIINEAVIVGSGSGKVYAINVTTGLEIWNRNAGSAIAAPLEGDLNQPLTGLGAGEGYLVVPAGSVLTAWKLSGP